MAHGYPDFEGDKSGLYLKPEWAAKEGQDKQLTGSTASLGTGYSTILSYAVPTGKVLRITELACSHIEINNSAAYVKILSDSNELYEMVFRWSHEKSLSVPFSFAAGEVLTLQGKQYGNAPSYFANLVGYEVDA